LLGGVYYDYASKGDGYATVLKPVPASAQRDVLRAMLGLLKPDLLALPENLRYLAPPPPIGYNRNRESFKGTTGVTFDHFSPARAGADIVIAELLQPQRMARMAEQHALDGDYPGSDEVISALIAQSGFGGNAASDYFENIRHVVDWRILDGLFKLASGSSTNEQVREDSYSALENLMSRLERPARKGNAHARAARIEIRRFFERLNIEAAGEPEAVPPGSPIG
jgi:hypothetical protein